MYQIRISQPRFGSYFFGTPEDGQAHNGRHTRLFLYLSNILSSFSAGDSC